MVRRKVQRQPKGVIVLDVYDFVQDIVVIKSVNPYSRKKFSRSLTKEEEILVFTVLCIIVKFLKVSVFITLLY